MITLKTIQSVEEIKRSRIHRYSVQALSAGTQACADMSWFNLPKGEPG